MSKPVIKTARKTKPVVVAVSGGFDPVHVGHARMFEKARKLGDRLVVILNNDNWLKVKKGFAFMPEAERAELLRHLKWVDDVLLTRHRPGTKDMSVVEALERLKPDIFANGGDRKFGNIPEVPVCERLGIKMVFNVGNGGKVQSSSWLLTSYMNQADCLCGTKGRNGAPLKYGECHGLKGATKRRK